MITFIKSRILQNPAIPCLPLLIIYILSILPLTLNYLFNISFITLILWIPVFAFFKMKLIPLNHLVIIISVGLISSYLNCTSHKDHISNFVGSSKTYLTVKGTITNVHFPNKILQWNAKTPKFILEITEISLKNETERAKGRVLVQNLKENYQFGDSLILTGRLSPINPNAQNIFSYESYLKQQNISHTLYADESAKVSAARGLNELKLSLYKLRDIIIAKATDDLSDSKYRRIVASIFFGYKGILERKERDLFQKSGTAHLFAVSGLHVGIAASFIYFLIRILRIRNRHTAFFLILPLMVYVIMTGAPPSAIRALIMLSVWTIARSFLLPSSGLNNLAVSALIILIINPLDLFSLGFIYTFTITTSLVMSFEKSLNFFKTLNEKNAWKGNFSQQIPFLYKTAMLLFCSLTASLASYGLNIAFNEQVIPIAFFTNFFSSILAWLSFFIASISILEIPLLYSIQNIVIQSLLHLVDFGSVFWNVQPPNTSLIIFYYLFLFGSFSKKNKHLLFPGLAALCLLILSIPAPKNQIYLYTSAGSNIPTLDIKFENKRYLINATSNKASYRLTNEKVNNIFFSNSRASHSWSLGNYLENSDIDSITTTDRHLSYLKKKFPKFNNNIKSGNSASVKAYFSEINSEYTFELNDRLPDDQKLDIKIVNNQYGECLVYINFKGFKEEIKLSFQDHDSQFSFALPDA